MTFLNASGHASALTKSPRGRPPGAGVKVFSSSRQCFPRPANSGPLLGGLLGSGLLGCGLLGHGLLGADLLAAEPPLTREYQVTTDTGMPHLDENLRYARRTEIRCLDLLDLSEAFWMLRDVSLQDCRLLKTSQWAEGAEYVLTCEGGHGTTGKAAWQLGPGAIGGSLNVRLGGKNMTFYQRVTATPVGTCR